MTYLHLTIGAFDYLLRVGEEKKQAALFNRQGGWPLRVWELREDHVEPAEEGAVLVIKDGWKQRADRAAEAELRRNGFLTQERSCNRN